MTQLNIDWAGLLGKYWYYPSTTYVKVQASQFLQPWQTTFAL